MGLKPPSFHFNGPLSVCKNLRRLTWICSAFSLSAVITFVTKVEENNLTKQFSLMKCVWLEVLISRGCDEGKKNGHKRRILLRRWAGLMTPWWRSVGLKAGV